MIKHQANGKHRIAPESDFVRTSQQDSAGMFSAEHLQQVVSSVQSTVVDRSSEFIRQRPGTSLLIAAAIGGMVGWLIKRRG
jgi:ElaB/YqjD/DUF883 family membrane-anchored ribosome-binding protein